MYLGVQLFSMVEQLIRSKGSLFISQRRVSDGWPFVGMGGCRAASVNVTGPRGPKRAAILG